MSHELKFKNLEAQDRLKQLAQLISVVFSPLLMIPLIILVTLNYTWDPEERVLTLISFILGGVIPILAVLTFLKLTGKITDWGISVRTQRYRLNIVAVVSCTIILLVMHVIENISVFQYTFMLFILTVLFTLLTFFTKISAHTSSITLIGFTLVLIFGIEFWWVFTLIPIVVWARVELKKHTLFQALCGAILTACVFLLMSYLFNWYD